MTNTKAATSLTVGDEIYYTPNVITVTKMLSNTAVVGFNYNDASTGESLYGWFNTDDMIELA